MGPCGDQWVGMSHYTIDMEGCKQTIAVNALEKMVSIDVAVACHILK